MTPSITSGTVVSLHVEAASVLQVDVAIGLYRDRLVHLGSERERQHEHILALNHVPGISLHQLWL